MGDAYSALNDIDNQIQRMVMRKIVIFVNRSPVSFNCRSSGHNTDHITHFVHIHTPSAVTDSENHLSDS